MDIINIPTNITKIWGYFIVGLKENEQYDTQILFCHWICVLLFNENIESKFCCTSLKTMLLDVRDN